MRLQVLFDEREFDDPRAITWRHGTAVSEWVRRARRREPDGDARFKIEALRAATSHSCPTATRADARRDRARVPGRFVVLVDPNIPMYPVGAGELVDDAVAAGERLVTGAEVVQEILHRHVAIERPEAIRPRGFERLPGARRRA